MAGRAENRDPDRTHLTPERGFLIPEAKEAFRSARAKCPHAVVDEFGMSACGLVLANTPINVRAKSGTKSVAECRSEGTNVDDSLCQSLVEKAIDF